MNAIIVYKATTDNFIPSMDCGLKKQNIGLIQKKNW